MEDKFNRMDDLDLILEIEGLINEKQDFLDLAIVARVASDR